MLTEKKPYVITRGKVIFDYSTLYCESPEKLLRSDLFVDIVARFLDRIGSRGSTLHTFLNEKVPPTEHARMAAYLTALFRVLLSHTAEEVSEINKEYGPLLSDKEKMIEIVEELYNYWRRYERMLYMEAPKRSQYAKLSLHHAQFIKSNDEFKNLVLHVYRRISENLVNKNPSVYRQLPAGANMGMLLEQVDWSCPDRYAVLKGIPFIRLSLIEPPVILYPAMNKRKGKFEEIANIADAMLTLSPDEWFCYPAKVGDLTAFIYFHQDFSSLALSLCNLFEIADYEDIDGKTPDIVLLFGLTGKLPGDTVFCEDKTNNMLIGLVTHKEEMDYFGYFKKMTLTLHNIAMLKRNRLPLHGAMACIKLKNGGSANVVFIGDSGAGKSETLEALRVLADTHISEMLIVFDDMGSIGVDANGEVVGFGTEIGAFVRLDDLQPGYAYEEIDRSIFMSPDKTNARLIMPITRYHSIVKGFRVDMFLYVNNFEEVNEDFPAIEFFPDSQTAIPTFRSAARLAKGTTDEKGLVHTYFANPFGAPQRKEAHEKIAKEYFELMFKNGVKVGQIRTRLGIDGFEQIGPREASMELFKEIQKHASK